MNRCLLLAQLLFGITQGGTVSGKILDREGKPLVGAQLAREMLDKLDKK